jgi:hypothetical protein
MSKIINMKGVNIWNAESFEKDTNQCRAGITEVRDRIKGQCWVKYRPMGFCSFSHNLKCAIEVFLGKADIIYFYKQ